MSFFAPNRRANITLYSRGIDPYSQRVRIVLSEKGVPADIVDIDKSEKYKEELMELNPYGNAPTLMDRDLVVYQSEIIMEYLDERFPHPPLMPVYPVARARSRLMIHRINRDWYSCMDKILKSTQPMLERNGIQIKNEVQIQESHSTKETKEITEARKTLKEGLMSISPVFTEMPFFLSEEFSLVDCCMAPLLWRLPLLGITLPPEGKNVLNYGERLFEREAFQNSLTDIEKTMRR